MHQYSTPQIVTTVVVHQPNHADGQAAVQS